MAHLLLVEDHPLVGPLLAEAVQDAGHTADCVTTKTEAERLLGTRAHALAVIDVRLPDGNGRDFALSAESLGVETVLITGDHDEAAAMVRAGITHLVKPFGMAEFQRLITTKLLTKHQGT